MHRLYSAVARRRVRRREHARSRPGQARARLERSLPCLLGARHIVRPLISGLKPRRTSVLLNLSDRSMERVEADVLWSMFDPTDVSRLAHSYGHDFRTQYTLAEDSGLAVRTMPARQVLTAIMVQQLKTGTPAIVFSDSANRTVPVREHGCPAADLFTHSRKKQSGPPRTRTIDGTSYRGHAHGTTARVSRNPSRGYHSALLSHAGRHDQP